MSRTRPNLRLRLLPLFAVVAALATAVPAAAYVVFLKDGSEIVTREKYRLEGDKAILVLQSGTETFYDAAQIDVERTEEYNQVDYGSARLIDGPDVEQLGKTPEVKGDTVTLQDLVGDRDAGLALPEPKRRPRQPTEPRSAPPSNAAPRTQAGFLDLVALPRSPYRKSAVMGEVMRYLKGQGVEEVRIYQGSRPDRPLVEINAASEASVFKALKDAANGLVQVHQRYPQDVTAFELLLLTENQVRAGQFTLTPELADQLVTGELEPPSFFLRYVEF